MENAIQIIFEIAILVFSVVIHEVSHGYMALFLGDHTAQFAGRLTLNPIKHIDPVGSILVPSMLAILGAPIIGWARPVPFNPYNLRNKKWGPALVGIAGPAANIALAVFFGLFIRFSPLFSGLFNEGMLFSFLRIIFMIALLNLSLAVFNLVPIPPLDGSKVLVAFLPYQYRNVIYFLEQYGIIFIFLLLPLIGSVISPLIERAFSLITGLPF